MISIIVFAVAVVVAVVVAVGAIVTAAGKKFTITPFEAVFAFLKKSWGWIVAASVAVAGILIAVQWIRARLGAVAEKWFWKPVRGDETRIDLWEKGGGKMHTVKLPLDAEGKQIVAADVVAAGISEKGVITVETLHVPTDRRGIAGAGQ